MSLITTQTRVAILFRAASGWPWDMAGGCRPTGSAQIPHPRTRRGEAEVCERFKRARTEGDLPEGVDPGDLTRYLATVLTGLSVQAANGAGKAKMTRVVEMALRDIRL